MIIFPLIITRVWLQTVTANGVTAPIPGSSGRGQLQRLRPRCFPSATTKKVFVDCRVAVVGDLVETRDHATRVVRTCG